MNREQLSNFLGNMGLLFVALTLPAMIACAIFTISENKVMTNVCLFLSIFNPIVGGLLLGAANKLSR